VSAKDAGPFRSMPWSSYLITCMQFGFYLQGTQPTPGAGVGLRRSSPRTGSPREVSSSLSANLNLDTGGEASGSIDSGSIPSEMKAIMRAISIMSTGIQSSTALSNRSPIGHSPLFTGGFEKECTIAHGARGTKEHRIFRAWTALRWSEDKDRGRRRNGAHSAPYSPASPATTARNCTSTSRYSFQPVGKIVIDCLSTRQTPNRAPACRVRCAHQRR